MIRTTLDGSHKTQLLIVVNHTMSDGHPTILNIPLAIPHAKPTINGKHMIPHVIRRIHLLVVAKYEILNGQATIPRA
jgi:hypothetical protein